MGAKSSGLFSSFKFDGTKYTSGRSLEFLRRKGWLDTGSGWGRSRVLCVEEKKKEKVERDVQQHDVKTTLKQRKNAFSPIASIFRTGGQR